MYINKIDDLIDKIIDDFYANIVIKNKKFALLKEDQNFVKHQKEINDILVDYVRTINDSEIRELVKNEDNVHTITNIIKRYITFYLFLTIGAFYNGKIDTYVNNVVEFSKNQAAYPFRVENFFNSENNALLIKYNELIKNIITLVDLDQTKLNNYSHKPEYKDAVSFLNTLGSEYINTAFKLENLNDNVNEQVHNIIKTVIILLIYKKTEKEDVFRILETIENENGEYMFIDIVMPKTQHIDFSSIEGLLTQKEVLQGLAHEFWGYLTEAEDQLRLVDINNDDKILHLINSHILVPIVDDFLMYHKDSERYDKVTDVNTKSESKNKKKEDTKIRYIVNKIDRASELYSDQINSDPKIKGEVKRLFHAPFADRKAVLYNNNEDIKIINKLLNQGKRSIENNEYYNDLIHYRKYPYINFKDFRDYGFSISLSETIDVVRSISLDPEQKQNDKNYIQLRIGEKDQIVNIVGFIIPTNTRPIECLKIRDFSDIRSLDKKQTPAGMNGYNLVNNYMQKSNLNTKLHQSSLYWLFDLNHDQVNMDTYEQINKLGSQDQVKYLISKLYDDIINEIYYEIKTKLNTFKDLPFYNSFKIMEIYEKATLKIPRDSDLYVKMEEFIFYDKSEKSEALYDENDDKFFGLSGNNIIKLQKIPQKSLPKIQTVKLNIANITAKAENIIEETIIGVCQHFISWEKITELRKKDPNKYGDMLFNFVEQYVIENAEQEFICKSCGTQLHIKKFILDGTFDDESQRFITFSSQLVIPLEDIPEYVKYNVTIRNIDKIIERIASICNIPYFIGTNDSVKYRRKAITKDVIDIVILNNAKLKKNFKDRNINSTKQYGISRELSNLFVFDLDNSIFVYSSKEKDYYKLIKYNNVLAYIIILMIIELNNSHISFMYGDKKGLCNYPIFEKFGHTLFDNLKIRKNNKGDTIDIKQYKTLCYILYVMSCFITKYNMWHYQYSDVEKITSSNPHKTDTKNNITDRENKEVNLKQLAKTALLQKKKKKFDPKIQKIVIHTVLDVLNSIIEISNSEANNQRLYDVISTKYYKKMAETFSDASILNVFKPNDKNSITIERKDYVLSKINNIPLTRTFKIDNVHYDLPFYRSCKMAKFVVPPRKIINVESQTINNLTNCPNGDFHRWKLVKKIFVCEICGTSIDAKYDDKITNKILENIKYVNLTKIAKKYCNDGTLHNYIFNGEKNCNVCDKCKTDENFDFSHEQLDRLEKAIKIHKDSEEKSEKEQTNNIKNEEKEEKDYVRNVLEKLYEHFKRDSTRENQYKFLDQFINNIQAVIGEGISTNSSSTLGTVGKEGVDNILLRDNIYIIDHDYNGYHLEKPIVIADKDNIIGYISNHKFFNTDVIYYTSHKNGKLDVFYDATTHILLGYKESSKEYVSDKKTNKKIKINYSVLNRLKLMGYPTRFVNIKNRYETIEKEQINMSGNLRTSREEIMKDILSDIIRDRIKNLKKVITEMQRFIYRIKYSVANTKKEKPTTNNYSNDYQKEEELNMFDTIFEKYNKKLVNIKLEDSNKKHKIFKHWKAVTYNIFADDMDDKVVRVGEGKLYNVEEINKYDINGNVLLYYIVTEIDKLIHFNDNKAIRTSIVMFLIDFISSLFNLFNTDDLLNIYDIKRFMFVLESQGYVHDIEEKGHGLETETQGIYEEYKDEDEKQTEEEIEAEDDAEEEDQALDIDVDGEYDADPEDYYPRMFDDWDSSNYEVFATY